MSGPSLGTSLRCLVTNPEKTNNISGYTMVRQLLLKPMLINMSHSKSTKVSLSQSKPEKVKKERNYNVVS